MGEGQEVFLELGRIGFVASEEGAASLNNQDLLFFIKYGIENGLVVGLSGTKSKGMIWPWEIGRW